MQSTSWPCIYCRKVSEGKVPRAHVAPECILANEIVLPAGAECAACNSALGTVDRELVKHNRIRGPIMLLAAPGKGRRQRRELGPLRRDPETGDLSTVPVIRDASWTAGELSLQIPGFNELDDLRFRRALHHMAFNYPAHKLGVETVLKPEFDPVRVYVRRPAPSAKWQYAQTLLPDAAPRR